MTQPLYEIPGDREQPARMPLWLAICWVIGAGIAAQVLGSFVSGVLRSFLHSHGARTGELDDTGFVIVPAMMVAAGAMTAAALIAPSMAGVPLRRALGLTSAPPSCFFAAALGTVMLGPFADRLMTEMQRLWPDASLGVLPFLHDLVRQLPLIAAWPALALLPGISEELMFRGLLQRAAGTGLRAIALSAGAFALFHIDPHHVVGVLPLGLFLAWAGSRCGTWVTIFAHVTNNTLAIVAAQSEALDVGYGSNAPMPLHWVPPSLALVALACWLIVRATPKETELARSH
ncbi:MAG TPA: CPBP family intramembrane glutamic endopeptidase [Polyangiales bacterium]|nr:CPBP family intramembrane glutamic endopeptidase [Polyangiales bacterium]